MKCISQKGGKVVFSIGKSKIPPLLKFYYIKVIPARGGLFIFFLTILAFNSIMLATSQNIDVFILDRLIRFCLDLSVNN